MKYKIILYTTINGSCDIKEYLNSLNGDSSKNARIKRIKILSYIKALAEMGVLIGQPYVKHIRDDIWELRPMDNRILFFYFNNNQYILLHHFEKTTAKTPVAEIEKAFRERDDYIKRFGNETD